MGHSMKENYLHCAWRNSFPI